MLTLTVRRVEVQSGMYVSIVDGNKYVEGFFTDEIAVDDWRAAKQAFMDTLCKKWYQAYGEHIKAVKESDAHEWAIFYDDTISNYNYETEGLGGT